MKARLALFHPLLAGATLKDRLLACAGALAGIGLTGLICTLVFGHSTAVPLIVAPMGASAVLLFAVPASPLAQPWSVVGGNMLSALSGVVVSHVVPDPFLASGLAVALAILVMSLTRCLHPPGGAAALTAVVGGAAVKDLGFLFPFMPVAVNSVALVALAILFHKMARHNYPHRPAAPAPSSHKTTDAPPALRAGFTTQDIDAALADMHETLDIDRGDLDSLLRQVEQRALLRSHGEVRCADIMSKDVVMLDAASSVAEAKDLLLRHELRALPVVSAAGVLLGVVGHAEVESGTLAPIPAATARPQDAAINLLPVLTSGETHDVVITDAQNHVLGIVSSTDLLAALGKSLLWQGR